MKTTEINWAAIKAEVNQLGVDVGDCQTATTYGLRLTRLLQKASPNGNSEYAPSDPFEALEGGRTSCLSAAIITLAAADTPPTGVEVGLYEVGSSLRPYPHYEVFCIDQHQGRMIVSGREGVICRPVQDYPSTRVIASGYRLRTNAQNILCASWGGDQEGPILTHEEASIGSSGIERLKKAGFTVATFTPYAKATKYIGRVLSKVQAIS